MLEAAVDRVKPLVRDSLSSIGVVTKMVYAAAVVDPLMASASTVGLLTEASKVVINALKSSETANAALDVTDVEHLATAYTLAVGRSDRHIFLSCLSRLSDVSQEAATRGVIAGISLLSHDAIIEEKKNSVTQPDEGALLPELVDRLLDLSQRLRAACTTVPVLCAAIKCCVRVVKGTQEAVKRYTPPVVKVSPLDSSRAPRDNVAQLLADRRFQWLVADVNARVSQGEALQPFDLVSAMWAAASLPRLRDSGAVKAKAVDTNELASLFTVCLQALKRGGVGDFAAKDLYHLTWCIDVALDDLLKQDAEHKEANSVVELVVARMDVVIQLRDTQLLKMADALAGVFEKSQWTALHEATAGALGREFRARGLKALDTEGARQLLSTFLRLLNPFIDDIEDHTSLDGIVELLRDLVLVQPQPVSDEHVKILVKLAARRRALPGGDKTALSAHRSLLRALCERVTVLAGSTAARASIARACFEAGEPAAAPLVECAFKELNNPQAALDDTIALLQLLTLSEKPLGHEQLVAACQHAQRDANVSSQMIVDLYAVLLCHVVDPDSLDAKAVLLPFLEQWADGVREHIEGFIERERSDEGVSAMLARAKMAFDRLTATRSEPVITLVKYQHQGEGDSTKVIPVAVVEIAASRDDCSLPIGLAVDREEHLVTSCDGDQVTRTGARQLDVLLLQRAHMDVKTIAASQLDQLQQRIASWIPTSEHTPVRQTTAALAQQQPQATTTPPAQQAAAPTAAQQPSVSDLIQQSAVGVDGSALVDRLWLIVSHPTFVSQCNALSGEARAALRVMQDTAMTHLMQGTAGDVQRRFRCLIALLMTAPCRLSGSPDQSEYLSRVGEACKTLLEGMDDEEWLTCLREGLFVRFLRTRYCKNDFFASSLSRQFSSSLAKWLSELVRSADHTQLMSARQLLYELYARKLLPRLGLEALIMALEFVSKYQEKLLVNAELRFKDLVENKHSMLTQMIGERMAGSDTETVSISGLHCLLRRLHRLSLYRDRLTDACVSRLLKMPGDSFTGPEVSQLATVILHLKHADPRALFGCTGLMKKLSAERSQPYIVGVSKFFSEVGELPSGAALRKILDEAFSPAAGELSPMAIVTAWSAVGNCLLGICKKGGGGGGEPLKAEDFREELSSDPKFTSLASKVIEVLSRPDSPPPNGDLLQIAEACVKIRDAQCCRDVMREVCRRLWGKIESFSEAETSRLIAAILMMTIRGQHPEAVELLSSMLDLMPSTLGVALKWLYDDLLRPQVALQDGMDLLPSFMGRKELDAYSLSVVLSALAAIADGRRKQGGINHLDTQMLRDWRFRQLRDELRRRQHEWRGKNSTTKRIQDAEGILKPALSDRLL